MRTHSTPISTLRSPTSIPWRGLIGLLLVTLLLALGVLALNFAGAQAQPTAPPVDPVVAPVVASAEPAIEYVPNTALLKLKPGVALAAGDVSAAGAAVTSDAASLDGLLGALNVTAARPLFASTGVAAAQAGSTDATGLARIYRVQWSAPIPVEHAVAALAADPAVEYAEPDYIARAARTPNDPEYAAQWALPKINAPAAWDVTTGAADVVIAIIDSGVDTTHPDFAGRLWQNNDPANGADDDHNGQVDDTNGWNILTDNGNLTDPNGHGSQVGGVAGAATDNGAGVAGVCWGCKLMFVNAMQASGVANYSDIAAAVQYAASNGAQVINLSLGGYADSAALRDAIREAATTAVIVAGAGNDDSSTPFYPAAYSEVLAVAATDSADQKAIFSNYGAWVDVSAPGKDIRTTTVSGYATDSGTSLAAPFVAGLAGLVKSQHPAWTAEQIKWQVLNTATAIDALNPTRAGQVGKGRIDAGAALTVDPQPRAAVESYALDGAANARPAPGQTFQLVLNVRNLWLLGQNLQGALSSSDPYVSLTDGAGAFGDIAPGQLGSNSGDPFGVTVSGGAPYNHALQFTLTLSGAGGYSLAVPFTIQVRSAVETLGNTIYSADTTWTSDKTYVLAGAVIVNQGVTLTIQPGTVIKGNPGKFIRVDGTLIARGTAAQPILFTTNSITNATWSGIRFAEGAINASFDADNNYIGGSILQYVEISRADIGVSLSGRTPYIADSAFSDNTISVQTWTDTKVGGPVRFERNYFAGGKVDASGGVSLIQSTFRSSTAATNCGVQLRGGSPLLFQNTFWGTQCGIFGETSYPVIASNKLFGGAIQLSHVDGSYGEPATLPSPFQYPAKVKVSAGAYHTCSVLAGGGVKCWGSGSSGQLGAGDNESSRTPQLVTSLADQATHVNAGGNRTCVLLENGGVQCWGSGENGQLGNGSVTSANLPQTVVGLAGEATQLAAGYSHTCALLANGLVQCWGHGGNGELGTGNNLNASTPQTVTGLVDVVTQLAAGAGHTCALLADGRLQCWGYGRDGALGTGSIISANIPQTVTGLAGKVIQVVAGGQHTCAILENNSVQCWGYGEFGELGTGNYGNATIPQFVSGLASGVNLLAAGYHHTCAVLTNGQMQCWGQGGFGQLGTGAFNNVSTPVTVTGLSDSVIGIAAGLAHTCALFADGNGQCWGESGSGQLGNGDVSRNYSFPQHIASGVTRLIENVVEQGGGVSISLSESTVQIQRNGINANTTPGLSLLCDNCRSEVISNTITQNRGYGISLSGPRLERVMLQRNNLVDNGIYDLYLTGGQAGTQNFTVDAANNFWNVDASQIAGRIRDCTFDDNGCGTVSSTVGQVIYNPPLANPDQSAPAFARSVTMAPQPVGVQRGTITIDFSVPMMTSTLPIASFYDERRGTTQQLTPSSAQVMTVDALGRIWFGLSNNGGVAMYDGRSWNSYTTVNSGIGGNNITALHGADNGAVWFAHSDGNTAVSKLQNSVWYTYPHSLPGDHWLTTIPAIGQDSHGAMWFAGNGTAGILRFDGSEWKEFTIADGLVSNFVHRIVRDGQGRMWFQTDQGLSVFDGANWTTHSRATGLPTNNFRSLFADSQGRVWVGLGWYEAPERKFLAMYDGAGWRYWGGADTNYRLNCDVNGVAEAPDGALWFSTCGNFATYDGTTWSTPSISSNSGSAFLFDARGNFWYNYNGLNVRWGGLDHPFTDGQWLSATRFQARYDFDANVPPGYYGVQTDGAFGGDGMAAYAGSNSNFQVAFSAGVTFDPPAPPQVAAQTNGSLTHLAASWQANSPNLDQYRYGIGTTPGGRDVVGWTYLAGTSFVRNDLNLKPGQSYYVTVGARNTSGLWSIDAVSNVVVAGQPPTPTPTATVPTPTPTASVPTPTPTAVAATPTPTASVPTFTPTILPGNPYVSPETGGIVTGKVGNLDTTITVPPAAVSEPVQFAINPLSTVPPTGGFRLLGQGIEITAHTSSDVSVTQFGQPLTLIIRYTDTNVLGLDETLLQLRYWDEVQQIWVRVPATVDPANNTITAMLDHLSIFALLHASGSAEIKLFLPSVTR